MEGDDVVGLGTRYDVVVGIGQYGDPNIPDLPACENDAHDLGQVLANIASPNGNRPIAQILSTADGLNSRAEILQAIEHAAQATASDDILLLAWSGHGATQNGESYLIPPDADPSSTASLIATDWLREILDAAPCRSKYILIDACHSGDANLNLKVGGLSLRVNSDSLSVELALASRARVFASSSKNAEPSYIKKDGTASIWIHNLCKAIDEESLESPGGLIGLAGPLSRAAYSTFAESATDYQAPQTPFIYIRSEGALTLGLAPPLPQPRKAPPALGEPSRLAAAMARAFEERFAQSYGKAMSINHDAGLQVRIHDDGMPHTLAMRLGASSEDQRSVVLAVSFAFADSMVPIGIEDLLRAQQIAQRAPVDRLILPRPHWSRELRERLVVLRNLDLVDTDTVPLYGARLYTDFFYDPALRAEDNVTVNDLTNSVLVQMGKIFHIALADLSSSTYDDRYGRSAFGTEVAMEFEEQVVQRAISRLDSRQLCVELGCGTGRHTFLLARYFDRVLGYDFSAGMISVANEKKSRMAVTDESATRTTFEVRDVELQPLEMADESVDLFLGSFGMGSFVDDIVPFLTGLKEQLRDGGRAVISFYNRSALVYSVPPPWSDRALSASLVEGHDELEVKLSDKERFRIFCRSYDYNLLKGQLSNIFEEVEIHSCPALSAFLPGYFFDSDDTGHQARSLIRSIDHQLARRHALPIGAYFTAVCTKRAKRVRPENDQTALPDEVDLGDRWIDEVRAAGIRFRVLEHARVRNTGEVRRVLDVPGYSLAKAVVIHIRQQPVRHVVFVVEGNLRLDEHAVSRILNVSERDWRLATQKEIAAFYGIEIGGVPPFGFGPEVKVYFDRGLLSRGTVVCGSGDPKRSLQLDIHDLVRLANGTVVDAQSTPPPEE